MLAAEKEERTAEQRTQSNCRANWVGFAAEHEQKLQSCFFSRKPNMNYGSDVTTLQVSKAGSHWDHALQNTFSTCINSAHTQRAAQQLECELWNRLPQVLIILFPSYLPDCLTRWIYISKMSFVLITNKTCPLPVPISEHGNHSSKSSLASFLPQNVCWTGTWVCYGHSWFIFILLSPHVPNPAAVTLSFSLPYRAVRRHSALVLFSFALQCLWTYWNCQHYWIWYLWHTSSLCKKKNTTIHGKFCLSYYLH